MLNPVCSEIDEKNVWRRTHEPYLDFSHQLDGERFFIPLNVI